MAVMNSWYEEHCATKSLPIYVPSRCICSKWEVMQWRLISTPQSTLALPFFLEVCKEVSQSAVYSVSTSKGGRCTAEGQKLVESLLFCGLNCHPCSHSASGSSLLSAKRRRTEQEDREKGMLECAKEHAASGNVMELESRSSV